MKKLLFLLHLPYSMLAQDENAIRFDTAGNSPTTMFAYEKAYMSDEQWIVFRTGSGELLFSNMGYLTYSDSAGDSRTQNVDCEVYPIIRQTMDSIFLRQEEYYWYSDIHFQRIQEANATRTESEKFTYGVVNGEKFTFQCSPEYFLGKYKRLYPDAVLVNKLPREQAIVSYHY